MTLARRSDAWAATVRDELPRVLRGVELGDEVLEVGPGPGLTTDLFRTEVPHVTASGAAPCGGSPNQVSGRKAVLHAYLAWVGHAA